MTEIVTLLDAAHAAVSADPGNEALRLRFFERLADGEMVILLEREAAGESIEPKVFDLEDGPVVLVFDREERLADFSGGIAPYAALPGRVIAGLLKGQGIGMGVSEAEFYDLDRVDVVPMAFCFPGYDAKGSDLPPPPVCATAWRARLLAELGTVPLTLLVGGAAIRWHLGLRDVTAAVADWRGPAARGVFPLPHPSWRNTAWLKRHPWFEAELVPELRARVRAVMETE